MRIVIVAVLAGAVWAAAPPLARAQQNPEEAAAVHYEAGEQYYVRGQYPDAIREFQEAYRIAPAPALLYNISQAYERGGDLVNARDYLAKYIASGAAEPAEKPVLEDKLHALDQRIADEKAGGATAPPPLRARPWRTLKWVFAGAGAALFIGGVVFAIDASRMQSKIEDNGNGTLDYAPEYSDAWSRGERDELLARILLAGGGALAVAGAVTFYLDHRAAAYNNERRLTAAPFVGPGLAGAALRWHF